MDIHPRAMGRHDVHTSSPCRCGAGGRPLRSAAPWRARLPEEKGGARLWCRPGSGARSVTGAGHHPKHDLTTSPTRLLLAFLGRGEGWLRVMRPGVPMGQDRSVADGACGGTWEKEIAAIGGCRGLHTLAKAPGGEHLFASRWFPAQHTKAP